MTCNRCGRGAQGRLCRDCEREERAEEMAAEELGRVVDDPDDDSGDDNDTDRGDGVETDGGTPWGYDKLSGLVARQPSHFCEEVGSTVFAEPDRCPYCHEYGEDVEDAEDGGNHD